ncbi:hypothetical protein A2U01_0066568, partial [Trifolium medium]|nr:hypothetical protein [Trifolium medium]
MESTASIGDEPIRYWGMEGGGLPKVISNGENPVEEWTEV